MCGIAFVFRPNLEEGALCDVMAQALALLGHRGPDGSGQAGQTPWRLGNRRLAIIDLPGSRQPMADKSGRYHLSYNGELYNYQALRSRLQAHWDFRSQGDTEVVLAGLVVYGTEFLKLMEGMWALALWDHGARELLLVRDRMGQRPLYYQSDAQAFACASELPALRPLSWFDWREDPASTADYLRHGYYLPGTTAYRQVREVLPGHWLRWAPGREMLQRPYWALSPGGFSGSRDQACGLLNASLVESVRHRLVSDVEVGALLSGGVDSSLMVALVTRRLQRAIRTFTMGFDDATYDERRFARRMAAFSGSTHLEERLTLAEGDAPLDAALKYYGQPFADGSILPTALVCRLAARHVKVALSGDGGDELFGGYQRYLARSLLRWYTRLPAMLRGQAARMVQGFAEPGAHHSASLLKKAHLFIDVADRMATETPYVAPTYYSIEDLRRLAPDLWRKGHPPPQLPETTALDDVQRMMTADALVYLPQDILAKVDRAGMAFSLEVRSPFLDRRVVELAFSLPRRWHRWGLMGKRMLRDTFRDLLPGWVWRRRKHGFGVPVHQWFRQGLQERLLELIEHTPHPLDRRFVKQMVAAHLSGRRDHGQRLWQLYVYLRWRAERPWRPS
jgi:asparagine synthase (glutamine-hydrolysing)